MKNQKDTNLKNTDYINLELKEQKDFMDKMQKEQKEMKNDMSQLVFMMKLCLDK